MRRPRLTTLSRELAREFSPDQLRNLALHLNALARANKVDRRRLNRLSRAVQLHAAALKDAERELAVLLRESGKDDLEILEELKGLRAAGAPEKQRRGRRSAASS